MHNPTVATRVYTSAIFAGLALLLGATTARAQYQPRPLNDPATGEKFIVEADASLWSPGAQISFESSGLGIVGSQIDAKRDLGVADERIPSLNVQLRPARSHHIRFQYVPIEFSGATRITRDLVFNGIRYQANVPVNSSLDWKSYRFGYQYDFIVKNQGFAGVIVEAKYTDVTARLATPLQQEFTRQRAPIPALGGIGRVYVVPNISVTGELTYFTIPDSVGGRYQAHYTDFDLYGTVNFTNNIGVKGGYRSLDLGYHIKDDLGSFTLKGIYFGAVLRY